MKKNTLRKLFTIIAALGMGVVCATVAHKEVKEVKAEENVIYSEDFSNEENQAAWNGNIDFKDGRGYWTAASTWCPFPVAAESFPASGNVEFSFNVKMTEVNGCYIHLVHLDGSGADKNIYLELISGGAYLRLANYAAGDVYNNSGEDQGCRWTDGVAASLQGEAGLNIKFIVFGDVIDVICNDVKVISTQITRFGNNRYSTRAELVKGIIDGVAIDYRGGADGLSIDNVVIKEAVAGSTDYVWDGEYTGGLFFAPLNATNLYQPNFMMEATFEAHRSSVEDTYPNAITGEYPKLLANLIHPTTQNGDPTNNVILQANLDREFANGWLGAKKADWNWGGAGFEYAAGEYSRVLHTFRLEVFGDNIRATIMSNTTNADQIAAGANCRVVNTTFTDLGVTDRGALLTAYAENSYTNLLHFEYHGYADASAVTVTPAKTKVTVNDAFSAKAFLFGNAAAIANPVWYVDGEATTVSGLEYNVPFTTEGKHTIAYGNDTVKSVAHEIEVAGRILTIAADKTEVFKDETVTFTATKEGSFTEDVKWYVDGVEQSTIGDTFALNGFTADTTVNVVAKAHGLETQATVITVKQDKIYLESAKGSYKNDETLSVTATPKGFADTASFEWYVDDVKIDGQTTKDFAYDLANVEGGKTIKVKCVAEGVTSEVLDITVLYDVAALIKADENYKNVYTKAIQDETFGGYTKVVSEAGDYYMPANYNSGNDASFDAFGVESFKWTMEYDFLVPETVDGEYYIYPQMAGMDINNPNDAVEIAIAVNNDGTRTYIKFHNRGINLEETDFGTGVDETYGAGVVTRGWNHCLVAVDQTYVAIYLNGVMTLFANVTKTTVPSTGYMSMWFSGKQNNINTGFKNFKIGAIVTPPPAVTAVSLSANKISGKVGDTFTFNANLTPFNAVADEYAWYVNDQLVTGEESASFTYNPTAAGSYVIKCVVDGISGIKAITIAADTPVEPVKPAKKGCKSAIVSSIAMLSVLGVAAGALFLKKKEEN